jgi:hypothetical protein
MRRTLLCMFLALLSINTYAQGTDKSFEERMNEVLYGDLRKIERFGFIYVLVRSESEDKVGLKSEDLTDYLKLRYKNNFGGFPYKEITDWQNAPPAEKTGNLWCGVWTVGNSFPVAYHVECRMGSMKQSRIVEDAVLGYGNRSNVPETIRKTLDRMVSDFAIRFFKTRGEM